MQMRKQQALEGRCCEDNQQVGPWLTGKRRRIKVWFFNNFNISVWAAIFGWLVFCLFVFDADLHPHAWEKMNVGRVRLQTCSAKQRQVMIQVLRIKNKKHLLEMTCGSGPGRFVLPNYSLLCLTLSLLFYLGNPTCFGGVALTSNSVAHREVIKPTGYLFSVSLFLKIWF